MQKCKCDNIEKLEMYLNQKITETKDMQRCRCDYNKKLEMYLRKKYAETKDMPKCKCDYNQKPGKQRILHINVASVKGYESSWHR